MSEIPHMDGEIVNDVSVREVSSKVDTKAQVTQEVLSKATKLFMKLASNPLIRNTVSQAALQEVTKLVVSYDNKFGPGAAKNSAELLREISVVVGGDQNRAAEILDAVYKALPSVEQVTNQTFPTDADVEKVHDMTRTATENSLSTHHAVSVTPSPNLPNAEDLIVEENNTGGPVVVDTVTSTSNEKEVTECPEVITEKAKAFASEMLQDKALIFNPQDLDEAITSATKDDVTCLDAFKSHVLNIANAASKKEMERARMIQAAKSSLERWEADIIRQHPDIQNYVQKQLDATYNLPEGMIGVFDVQLGAYTVPGLANPKSTLREELNMDAYSNPVFAILRNLEKWEASVERSIAAMESDDFTAQVNAIIETSDVTIKGTLEEKRASLLSLANELPQLKGKNAPDNYKIWYLLTRERDNHAVPDMTARIYERTQDAINHQARTETYMASGIPQTPAMDIAYRESVKDIEEEEAKKRGLLDATGRIIGTIAVTPARCKKSIQDAMYEAMGEFGDEWKANQEAAKERKRKLKEQKAQQEFELAQKELELKTQMMAQQNMQKMMNAQSPYAQSAYHNQNLYGTDIRRGGHPVNKGDFAPRIPMPVIATLVHAIVALICWLIFGNVRGAIIAVGLVVASAGLFGIKSNGSKAILVTVAGYVVSVLAMVLF